MSLRYRAQVPVERVRFLTLIGAIGEAVGQQIEDDGGDFIFGLEVAGTPCMCAVVPEGDGPFAGCSFTVMTTAPAAPTDLSALEDVHAMIEGCFTAITA